MFSVSKQGLQALALDRRVQVGGGVGLALAVILGIGILTLGHSRAEATPPDMADQAGLTIETQSAPKPAPVYGDKIATIDPTQTEAVRQEDPVDAGSQAMLDEEHRQDRLIEADQKAFDASLRVDPEPQNDDVAPPPEQTRPTNKRGWTSNAEDAADGPST